MQERETDAGQYTLELPDGRRVVDHDGIVDAYLEAYAIKDQSPGDAAAI